MLAFYKKQLTKDFVPEFLTKYLLDPKILRLQKIGYFNGLEYISDETFSFSEKITMYDCAECAALLTYSLTDDEEAAISALYHYVATPCFSQALTFADKSGKYERLAKRYNESFIRDNFYLESCLLEDGIDVEDIYNIDKYKSVGRPGPKLSVIKLNEIILTAMSWTKSINENRIYNILSDIRTIKNEDNELEIGFKSQSTASEVQLHNNIINQFLNSNEVLYKIKVLYELIENMQQVRLISTSELYSHIHGDNYIINLLTNFTEKNYQNDSEDKKIIELFNAYQQQMPTGVNKDINLEIDQGSIEPIGNNIRIK